ncbi:MAG: hypothetical protein IT384_27365 [Deltaproteobacteria bacterium]|nr:hypothetical protein [Deltaproteobacteria bacterium]
MSAPTAKGSEHLLRGEVPLPLALSLIGPRARLVLRDHALASWLRVTYLELDVPGLRFPTDLSGGAARFQHHATRLTSLVLDVDLLELSRVLTGACALIGGPLESVRLTGTGGALEIEARLAAGAHDAREITTVALASEGGRPLRWVGGSVLRIGPLAGPPSLVTGELARAIATLSAQLPAPVRVTADRLDVLPALLWALFPAAGWKLPAHDELAPTQLAIGEQTAVLVFGEPPADVLPPPAPTADAALRALARADVLARYHCSEREHEPALPLFEELRAELDQTLGPRALLEWLLLLGTREPRLFAEAADLARDALELSGETAAVRLALGGLSALLADPQAAAGHYRVAAELLGREGQGRAKAFSLLLAARLAPEEGTAALLEEAAAAAPEDPDVLRWLAEALAAAGNAAGAVAAARRLAKVAPRPPEQAWASDFAGWQLLEALGDPIRAKREFERALRIEPERLSALEGLARALLRHGDPHRAALILERLIDRAEQSGNRALAATLSVTLGDLWTSWDREAALERYRRAAELDPGNVDAALRIADTDPSAEGMAAALEALELFLLTARGAQASRSLPPERRLALYLTAARLAAAVGSRDAEAIAHYEAALAINPASLDALEGLLGLLRRGPFERDLSAILARIAELRLAAGDLRGATAASIEEARVLDRAGADPAPVRRRLDEITARDPALVDAIEALIELAELCGAHDQLLSAIDRRLATASSPELRADLLARRGAALLRLERGEEAEAAFEQALVVQPAQARALDGLAALLRKTQQLDRLASALGRAAEVAQGPTRTALLTERARALADAGRTDEAFVVARGVLEEDPTGGDLLPLAVDLAIALGRLEEARALLERRASSQPALPPEARVGLVLELARVARSAGDAEAEIAALTQAIDHSERLDQPGPSLAQVTDRLAELLRQRARWPELAALERRRARASSGPRAAEHALEAARLFERLGETQAAEEDLAFLLDRAASPALQEAALGLWEELARRSGDPRRIANFLERRASAAGTPEAKAAIRIEQADVLTRAGLFAESADRLERALTEQPRSLEIARRLAEIAEQLGRLGLAARGRARIAQILEERGEAGAIAAHAEAADLFEQLGHLDLTAHHDRRVLDLGREADSARMMTSLRRLERLARSSQDPSALVEVLERWLRIETGAAAIDRLIEKAEVEQHRLRQPDAALATLRRARIMVGDGPSAAELDARLGRLLEELGRFEELAAQLDARAAKATEPVRAARLHLEAARVYAERLSARSAALQRARAAVRAAPDLPEARAMRQHLAAEDGGVALADALLEDAGEATSSAERVRLSLEAAEALAPLKEAEERHPRLGPLVLQRALEIAKNVGALDTTSVDAHRRAAVYARRLDRADEEFLALGRLGERTLEPAERLISQLRRVDLLRGPLDDPFGAQAELTTILASLGELGPVRLDRLREPVWRAAHLTIDRHSASVFEAVLRLGVQLTEKNEAWEAHIQYLQRLLEITESAEQRADLHFKIGEVTEWKLGDGNAAERQYLAALAIQPQHRRCTQALSSLYLAGDRFRDLAENLGIEWLRKVWHELREGLVPPQRLIAAGEALWPLLPVGSTERADVLLSLADLYRSARDEAEGAVMLLELVVKDGPPAYEPAALERLRVLFLEEKRFDLYVEILRRQSERLEGDEVRARALAEIGEALEWKLGDGVAAEREYRSALAVDPSCTNARDRLALLLASQDRFQELGSDLGREALEREVAALEARGSRESARVWRAVEALVEMSDAGTRAQLWLDLAERTGDEVDRIRALECAEAEGGEAGARATAELAKITAAARASEPAPPEAPEGERTAELHAPTIIERPGGARAPETSPVPELAAEPEPEPAGATPLPTPELASDEPPRPAEQRSAEERTAEERPAQQRPAEERTAEQPPAEKRPAEQRPAEERPAEQPPAEERPAEQRPAAERTAAQPPTQQRPAEKRTALPWRARILCAALQVRPLPDAAHPLALARKVLGRTPDRLELLAAAVDALRDQGEIALAAGPAQVLHLLHPEAATPSPPPLRRLPEDGSVPFLWRMLASEALLSPIGGLLSRTSIAVAALLPPGLAGERRPLDETSALYAAVRALERLLELTLRAEVEPAAAPGARVEPGEPPVLVLSEALLAPGREAAARYLIARAALELRLGTLAVDHPPPEGSATSWIDLLLRVAEVDAAERLDPPLASVIEPLRARLGPSGLADVESLAEKLRPRVTPEALEAWRVSAEKAASRFGLLFAGELAALSDVLGDQRGDALAFLAGEGYARLVASLAVRTPDRA